MSTVLYQTIQFNINTQFNSIWSIDRTLSGSTSHGQSGRGSDGNKGVLCIPQSSNIIGASPSGCLVSYPVHSLVGVLPFCRYSVGIFFSPSRLGYVHCEGSFNIKHHEKIHFLFSFLFFFFLSSVLTDGFSLKSEWQKNSLRSLGFF